MCVYTSTNSTTAAQISSRKMAGAVGFEPTELSPFGFQDRRHRPLGHAPLDIAKLCIWVFVKPLVYLVEMAIYPI